MKTRQASPGAEGGTCMGHGTRHTRAGRLTALLTGLFFLLPAGQAAAGGPPRQDTPAPDAATASEVMAAVQKDLALFLEHIPPGQEAGFGFGSGRDFGRAVPERAYPVYTVYEETIRDYEAGKPAGLLATGEWLVSIRNGEKAALMAAVVPEGDGWALAAIGLSGLAGQLPETAVPGGSAPKKGTAILRVYSLGVDCLLFWEGQDASAPTVLPLQTTKFDSGLDDAGGPLTVEELLIRLKTLP